MLFPITFFRVNRGARSSLTDAGTLLSIGRTMAIFRSLGIAISVIAATVVTAATAGASQAATPASVPPTSSVPSTIAADCSVDVSSALTSWVTTVPDNSVISFPTNGCYRIDSTVELDGRNGLDFEGNGSTLTATTVETCP